jgi:hypothetical protein
MSFVVKKRDLTDPAQLQALIVEHADDLERGLTILDSRLLLGQATIDVVALDADGALVLITVGLVADEEMFMKAVDAYSWCLEYPEAIRRLYPAVRFSTEQPPRVMFVVERMPDAFHRKIKQLGFHEVDCVEFRHLDVDGTAAVYFDTLARLRRGAVPTAAASDHGTAPAAPVANGRPTSLKLQKLLGADRPAAAREPAPIVRIVHRAASRPDTTSPPIAPPAERAVAPKQPVDATRARVEAPAPPASPPVVAAVATPAPSLDVVAASPDETAVPEILAQDLETADGMLEPFATLEPTRNGHVEPLAITLPEPEPVLRDLELANREPARAGRELDPAWEEPEPADVPLEAVPDVVAAELLAPADAVTPEPLTLDDARAPEPVEPLVISRAPELEPVQPVVTTSAPQPKLVIPVLELEPRAIVEADPAPEVPVIAEAEPEPLVLMESEPVVLTEAEPVAAALSLESAKPVVPVAAPAAPTSVFSRRPAEAAAARDAKVSFAGMAKDLLPRNHRAPETEPPVSAPRASVEEITRGALDELVGATDKRTSEEQPAAKAGGPFAKAPSPKRPRTIAPPPSEGQPIAGRPKLASSPKRVGAAEAAAPAAEGETAQPMPEGFEGLQFPNDGVLTRQWMEFLNQMAAGK